MHSLSVLLVASRVLCLKVAYLVHSCNKRLLKFAKNRVCKRLLFDQRLLKIINVDILFGHNCLTVLLTV